MSKHDELLTVSTKKGNITATKATLNLLSTALYDKGEKDAKNDCLTLAGEAFDLSDEIYFALKETGYYDDVCKGVKHGKH